MLQGGEGCEGAGEIIGEVDALVGPVVSGGEITGEMIGVLSGNQNDPKR